MKFFVNIIYAFSNRYSLTTKAFLKTKYSVVCTEFPICSTFQFSQWKIIFPNSFSSINTLSSFIKLSLKCEEPLFSTMKLKLEHCFFQFILRFKIGIFECGS